MPNYWERKKRLQYGAVTEIANQLDCAISTVAAVLKGDHRNRTIEQALADRMVPKQDVRAVFGPPAKRHKNRKIRRTR